MLVNEPISSNMLIVSAIIQNVYCIIYCIFSDLKEAVVTELQEGDLFFTVTSYMAENEDAINLVEGERVYVLGKNLLLNLTLMYNVITFCMEYINH
jgi:hypothetical protein